MKEDKNIYRFLGRLLPNESKCKGPDAGIYLVCLSNNNYDPLLFRLSAFSRFFPAFCLRKRDLAL
jgi:hypothetical protein